MRRIAITALALGLAAAAHAEPPARVVSVGGALTEIVFALGAGERVVAVDSTSTRPAATAGLPKVGYMRQLSAEGVLSMRPGLVIATSDAGPLAVLAQLRTAGVRVHTVPAAHSIEALRANVKAIAAALDAPEAGRALDARIAADWESVRKRVAGYGPDRPRVLFILSHTPNTILAAGRGTAVNAMIGLAGGVNALSGFEGYKPLTPESAVDAAPDVLLVTTEGLAVVGGSAKLLAHPGLAATPAGRSRRIVAMEALSLLGFGPQLPEAVRELAQRIHEGS